MVEAAIHQLNLDSSSVEEALVNQVSSRIPAKEPPPGPLVDYDVIQALVDTGAAVTCTDKLYALHYYKAYDALDKSVKVYPVGEGYLYVPFINQQDFIAVRCFYSPHLTSTFFSEINIMKTAIDYKQGFSGQTLTKFFIEGQENDNFTFICQHKKRHCQDILIHGVIISGQCYTRSLLLPDLSDAVLLCFCSR